MIKTKLIGICMLIAASVVAFAQDDDEQSGKFGETDQDSVECVKNLSLYIEFFRQNDYPEAVKSWKKAVKICPQSRKSLYINGVKMYTQFIKDAKDDNIKEQLIDSLMWIYDQRIEHFGQEGYVLGRKGSDLLKHRTSAAAEVYELLMKSMEMQKNKFEPGGIIYLYNAAIILHKKGELTKEEVLELYFRLSKIIENNSSDPGRAKYAKHYQTAQDNLDKLFISVASCEELTNHYQPKIEANPKDTTLLSAILQIFSKADCTDEVIYLRAAEEMFKHQPTAESARGIAEGKVKENDCAGAVEYFQKSAELTDDNSLKIDAYVKASKCYMKLGQFSSSRVYARKALAIDPNNGEAYLLIATAYGQSAKECGGTDDCTSKAAYWAAVDMAVRAKSVDPSVTEMANERIATYSKYFPKKQECFFVSREEGSSYTVGCWINETTTVRVLK